MKQIYMPVLLMGVVSPAFGLSTTFPGGGEVVGPVGPGFEIVNACGCDWSDADYLPMQDDMTLEAVCSRCNIETSALNCSVDKICDDRQVGNANHIIVTTGRKLTVSCGKWIPPKPESTSAGVITREGYWSPLPSVSCDTVYSYSCGAGYYGSPTSESSGCTKCPGYTDDMAGVKPTTTNNKYVISSEEPRRYISNCYIVPNSVGSDIGGAFIYTDGCFY
ncbi:MAG: hypothetical protein NC311_00895 [Muribaculaceae bacterium]|nr:hypothetical protein [Muribaculaceae bacterium]